MSNFWWYITVTMSTRGTTLEQCEEVLCSAAEISGSIGTELQDLPDLVRMRIYYRADLDISEHRARLLDALGDDDLVRIEDVGKIENQPWHKQCEDAFPPLCVGHGLVVLAPWHRGTEPQDRTAIYINPGSAFGTGYHESTQAALELLEHLIAERGAPARVVDVGTGSGILSIASIKLGAQHVRSRDLDPAVVDEVKGNIALNSVPSGRIDVEVGDLLKGVDEKFDLLFANILLEPNIALLPSVHGVLAPGGSAIFSGMTANEREKFLDALSATPLVVLEEIAKGEWWGVRAEDPTR